MLHFTKQASKWCKALTMLLVLSFGFFQNATAQLDVTLDDLPSMGKVQAVSIAGTPDIFLGEASDEEQVWDFTGLIADTTQVVEFKNPGDTPWGDDYPLSDMARTDDFLDLLGINLGDLLPGGDGGVPTDFVGTAYYGINSASGNIFTIGLVTDLDVGFFSLEDLTFNASPPDIYLTSEDFGESIENDAEYSIPIEIDLLPIPIVATLSVEKTITPDAYGTLELPSGSYEVLRYHEVSAVGFDLGIDLIPLPDTTIITETYRYVGKGFGYPLANVSVQNLLGTTTVTSIEYIDTPEDGIIAFQTDNSCLTVSTFNNSEFVYSYEWDFGDGSPTSGLFQPEHTYEDEGDYTITLTAIALTGDTLTLTQDVNVECPVSAAYFPNNECLDVTFFNNTENGASYVWDFGDGNTSTEESPVHTYAEEGIYTVSLTATGITGDEESISQQVTVECPVSAGFFPDANCLEVTFNNFSENGATYTWDFGDGNSSSEAEPVHTYLLPGTYEATLTVVGIVGDTETSTTEVTVDYCVGIEELDRLPTSILRATTAQELFFDVDEAFQASPAAHVYLIDLKGRMVQGVYASAGSMSISHLSTGMYILAVYDNGIPLHQEKLVIK